MRYRVDCGGKLIMSTKKGAETGYVSSASVFPQARARVRASWLLWNNLHTFAASASSWLFADRSASFVREYGRSVPCE